MISLSRQFAYVEIGKTASTSIKKGLTQFADLTGPSSRHQTASEYIEILGEDLWNDFFTAAVIRNPYDRIVSSWLYRQQFKVPRDVDFVDPDTSLETFIETHIAADPTNPEFRSHTDFLTHEGNVVVEHIFDFTELDQAWKAISEHVGVDASLPHEISSRRKEQDFFRFHTDKTAHLIETIYAEDFAWQRTAMPTPWRTWESRHQ